MTAANGGDEAPSRTSRHEWRVDVSDAVELRGRFEIAVSVVAPAGAIRDGVLFCLPGGFLGRKYFDLEVDGNRRFSFAESMARRGFATLAIDYIGVGDSSRPGNPEDGYRLGVDAISRANQRALERVLERLRGGELPGLERGRTPRTIGVGHSMGSALTVSQQALASPHDALVLFSFTTAGLPDMQPPEERHLAGDPPRAHAEMPGLVRERFGTPYPPPATNSGEGATAAFGVGTAPAAAAEALGKASTNLLAICGLLTMVPGAFTPYAEEVAVPTFVAVGDHDLHGTHDVGAMLPKSPEVVLYTVDDCWHCHHVANGRERLWRRVAHWIDGVT